MGAPVMVQWWVRGGGWGVGGAGTETEDTHLDRENAHRHSVGDGGGRGWAGRLGLVCLVMED